MPPEGESGGIAEEKENRVVAAIGKAVFDRRCRQRVVGVRRSQPSRPTAEKLSEGAVTASRLEAGLTVWTRASDH